MMRHVMHALVAILLLLGLVAADSIAVRASSKTLGRDLLKTDDPLVSRAVLRAARYVDIRHSMRICEPGAAWLRMEFAALRLKGADRLSARSDGGDRYEFSGAHWDGRGGELRALRGACVELEPHFANIDSSFRLAGYTFAAFPLTQSAAVVAAAGDICDTTGDGCIRTSNTVLSMAPNAAILLGDNVYETGTFAEYTSRYDPAWGRFKAFTKPIPGNHEYGTASAAGYFDYFNGVGVQSGLAGERDKGYYSWNIGEWHFVALNSNFSAGGASDTGQLDWLRNDLAANTQPCTAAYFHHPMVSVGRHAGLAATKPYWDALYAARADLILVGHDHNYQRYGKMTPSQTPALDGVRQIVVGTGGRALYPIGRTHPSLEIANDNSLGVLKLTLTANSYVGEFVPAAGSAFTDRFSARCNKATITDVIRTANCRLPPKRITLSGGKPVRSAARDPEKEPISPSKPRASGSEESPRR
jgi:acid phosphatase type 7